MSRAQFEREELPGGKVRVRATVGYVGKRQVRKQRVFGKGTLVRDIKAWVAREKAAFELLGPSNAAKVTLNDLSSRWLQVAKSGLKEQTRKRYQEMLDGRLLKQYGRLPVQRVGVAELDRLLEGMLQEGLSPRTIQYHFEVYRQVFEYALAQRVCASNPVKSVALPGLNKRRKVEVLEEVEVKKFLAEASSTRFFTLYLLLVTTGLRISEALALEWRDVDLEKKSLTVNKSVDDLYGERKASPPKSAHAYRTITIPQQLVDALASRERQGSRLFQPSEHPYKAVSREFKRLLSAIGAKPLTIHGLRHTACSMMLRQGLGLKVVQYAMGHHSASFTLDTYAHLIQGEADTVGPAIEAALGGLDEATQVQPHFRHSESTNVI